MSVTLGEERPAGRSNRHRVLAALMLVMLTALLVAKLLRAGFESSIWMDEVFSLELATAGARISTRSNSCANSTIWCIRSIRGF